VRLLGVPGFEFEDFEMAARDALLQQFPAERELVLRFTRASEAPRVREIEQVPGGPRYRCATQCDDLIAEGRVSINGSVVREVGVRVDEQRDRVQVDGRPVGGRSKHVYYVLNKPVGVITTLDDPQGRRTVREFLPRGARAYPVGRLDADTSGLLLLTNDGELAHKLMHPRYGVAKVYRVRLSQEPRADQLRRLASGVRFDKDLVSGPARVRRIDPGFDRDHDRDHHPRGPLPAGPQDVRGGRSAGRRPASRGLWPDPTGAAPEGHVP
jgi:hypothetical protein